MQKTNNKDIQKLLSSKTLHIKALTSAGIISGIVTDIMIISNSSKNSSLIDEILDNLSNGNDLTIKQDYLIYVIEDTKLYPISNLKEYFFLDRIELSSSKIIALCPLFEEVD